MLLTLVQLHILLAAVPVLSGWPTWAMLPAPALVAHVQRMGVHTAQAQAVAVRSAAVRRVLPAPVPCVLLHVVNSVARSAMLCPAHAPRAP